jgi:hypothetical protein
VNEIMEILEQIRGKYGEIRPEDPGSFWD